MAQHPQAQKFREIHCIYTAMQRCAGNANKRNAGIAARFFLENVSENSQQ
jgi:hypothetical protein